MYNKPVILSNDDLAEGVYAASGGVATPETTADSNVSCTPKQKNFWSNEGQITFTAALPVGLSDHVYFTVEFSSDFNNVWCDGGTVISVSGKTVVFEIWNPKSSFDFTAQCNDQGLSVVSATVVKA